MQKNTLNFTIQKPDASHLNNLAKLHLKVWQQSYVGIVSADYLDNLRVEYYLQLWKSFFQKKKHDQGTFVALQKNEIIGFVRYGSPREDLEGGEIYALYIDKTFQGQGLGKALFLKACSELKCLGYNACYLWVLKANESGRGFYTRMAGKLGGTRVIEIGSQTLEELKFTYKL